MRVVISGSNLPGSRFHRSDGSRMEDVHVGVQLGKDPAGLVRGDRASASWELDVDVVDRDGVYDFRGPGVHGKRGERFVYLTWGDLPPGGTFEMFRRAKLVLDRVPTALLRTAVARGRLDALVDLTDERGGPRCARVDPPAVVWSVPEA